MPGQGVNSFRFGTNHCYPINGTPVFNCYDSSALSPSTHANNKLKNWAHYTSVTNGTTTTLTFHGTRGFKSCFEYRVDGSLPKAATNRNPVIPDGMWDYRCVSSNGAVHDGQATPTSASVEITGAALIEVRMVYGAETDERFNWEIVS